MPSRLCCRPIGYRAAICCNPAWPVLLRRGRLLILNFSCWPRPRRRRDLAKAARSFEEVLMSAGDQDWLGLRDRVCVITGAASGIGRQTVIELAAVGAAVVAIDRDGNGCSQTIEEVGKQGGKALALECDVTEPESVSAAARRALAAGATFWSTTRASSSRDAWRRSRSWTGTPCCRST